MIESINNDLKSAMKNTDRFTLSVLRMLKSAIQLESINKKHELNDQEVISVIKKQVKIRKDSLEEYKKYEKSNEVAGLEKEIDILSKYLPEETSLEEINKTIDDLFERLQPSSMKDMGTVMREVTPLLPNADMSVVSKIIKDKLNK